VAVSVELAILVVAAGIAVGALSALFGVGGGILMVPFIVLALKEEQHLAEGTSLLFIIPTAVAGVLAHRRRGYVSFRHGALLACGGIAGAYVGALAALELSASTLQTGFGALLAVSGFRIIRRGIATMRAEQGRTPPAEHPGPPIGPEP
jgi:hypothetical protein